MSETLRRLLRLMAGYSLVTLVGPLIGLLFLPIYSRVLTTADYAVVDISAAIVGMVGLLAVFGTDQALSAHFFDGDGNYQQELVSSTVVLVCVLGLLLGSIIAIFATPLASFLFGDPTRREVMLLVGVTIPASALYVTIGAALRLRMGIRSVNLLALAYLVAFIFSNVILVLVFQLAATGVVAANAIANTVGAIAGLGIIYLRMRGSLSVQLIRLMVITGIGLLGASIGTSLLSNFDRLLLTQFVSQSEIGIYAMANKLTNVASVFLLLAYSAWWPMGLQLAKQPESSAIFIQMRDYFAAGAMGIALTLGLFAPEVLAVLTTPQFLPAAPYAAVLLLGTGIFYALTLFAGIGLYTTKHTNWVAVSLITAAIVNIILNLVLAPIFGVWGAVWATVIAVGANSLLTYFLSQRVFPIKYRDDRYIIIVGCFLICSSIWLIPELHQSVIIRVLTIALFAASLFVLGLINMSMVASILARLRFRVSGKG